MIDLSSFDVEVKKPLTQAEFNEIIEKGLIRSGEIVDVYDNYGNIVKTEYICIFPPTWKITIKELQKDNWQNKRLITNICKYQEDLWDYMKENNIIPGAIVNEIEKAEAGLMLRLV